jgi:hypothetical protein
MMAAYPELADRAFYLAAVEALIPLAYTGERPIGWIEREGWLATYPEQLDPQGLSLDGLDASFVQRIYGRETR